MRILSISMVIALCLGIVEQGATQCLTNVDFNNWVQEGYPSNGDWSVTGGGSNLYQSVNSTPTYYVSQDTFINVQIEGQFEIASSNDNDYVGFVFGYQEPTSGNLNAHDYYLFAWKQGAQTNSSGFTGQEGFTLARMNGNFTNNNDTVEYYFWEFPNTYKSQRLATDYGGNKGWNDNQTYSFRLTYTYNRIIIKIDNQVIFDVPGCYRPGRFGFYNNSQPDVNYNNFNYELDVDFAQPSQTYCPSESVDFVFADPNCVNSINANLYQSIVWDYGDGTQDVINNPTLNNVNTSHSFPSGGTYNVTLTVTDYQGCQASDNHTITIDPKPNADFTAGDTCFGKATQFNDLTSSTNPISNWSWDFGDGTSSNNQSPSHVYPDSTTYNSELIATDTNGCRDTAQKAVEVFPQPTISDSIIDVACFSGNSGEVYLDVAQGVTPLNYSWSNNANSQNLIGVSAGTYDVTVTDANGCSATNSATVNEPPELSATWTTSQYNGGYEVSCAGASDGSIDLTVNGGTPPYSYNWNNGQFSSQDLQNIPSGNYSVTITDANGCTLVRDTVLTEPPALSTSATTSSYAGGYQISCNGNTDGSIDLSVNGGVTPYSYDWNNGQFSSEDIQNVGAGTYTVVVTDANNCTTTFDTTLTEPAAMTSAWTTSSYAGGYHISCQGETDGSIDLTVNGGVTPYSYNWNNGAYSTEDIQNVSAGSYAVTVTDANGCSLTKDTVLTEPPAMTKDISSPTYSNGHNVSCYGDSDGEVNLTVNGGTSPYSYSWSNGDKSQDLTNVGAGQYSVTVTDANNCTIDTSITLTEPPPIEVEASLPTYNGDWHVSCNGNSDGEIDVTVTGGSTPYSYSWNGGTYTSEDLTNVAAGMYTLTVTDDEGCTAVLDTQLTEPPAIDVSSSTSDYQGGYNISCHDLEDGSIDVSPTGGTPQYDYSWASQAVNSPSIQNLGAADYSVTVTDQNGCQADTSITLTEPQPLQTSVTKEDVTCFDGQDGSVSLSATGGVSPYQYSWDNGISGSSSNSLSQGQYSATITDQNGCSDQKSVTIDQPEPLSIELPDTHKVVLGGETQLATDYVTQGRNVSFDWRPESSLSCPDTTGSVGQCDRPIVSPLDDMRYTVEMVDGNGCRVSASTDVVIKKDKAFFVPNAFTPNGDGKNETFKVHAKGVKEFKMQIFNRWGEEIYRSTDIEEGWDGTLRNGKRANASTYVYLIYLKYLDNSKIKRQGSFTLLR